MIPDDLRQRLASKGSVTFSIRVRPHAKNTAIKSVMSDGSMKIDLAAPAEDGKANQELLRFLSEEFDVPITHIELLSGQTSRKKVVRIQ